MLLAAGRVLIVLSVGDLAAAGAGIRDAFDGTLEVLA
jgi:hypothetical protein